MVLFFHKKMAEEPYYIYKGRLCFAPFKIQTVFAPCNQTSLATPSLDFSRLYFSLKNKNKIAFYFVLFSFIRIFAEQKVLRCVTVAAIS